MTVLWAVGRIGRVVTGDKAGDRGPIGDDGATAGGLGTANGDGEGGTRGDVGTAPSPGVGDSANRAVGEGDGGADCSKSTDV